MYSINKLDAVLEEIVTRWGIPGMAVGIVQENEIIYARGFGVQSLDTQAPVTPESIFCVASVAKCFVATALMHLVEQQRLDLDTPLVSYLPYFRLDDARYRRITIRQMLSHTSGLPDMDENDYDEMVAHPEYDEGAAERYVRALSGYPMVADPGERFLYSNIAYNVLGDLISKISGQTFEAFMQEKILFPAGMLNSTFLLEEVDRHRLAVPHLRSPEMIVNPVYPYHRADAPASFLHATLLDMCRWGITCLNQGFYPGQQRILTPASYELMWTPVAPWGYPPFYEDIGLGWTLGHYNGVKTVSHGGMGFGWTDFLTILPEKKVAAMIMSNEESWARSRTLRAVVSAMLDCEPQVDTVSWMVPVSQALQEGGIEAAAACAARIKEGGSPEYYMDEDELDNLAIQLVSLKKFDMAADVLKLNIQAYPESSASYLSLANIYLQKGSRAAAEEILLKALTIKPTHTAAARLLEKIRQS
jgi:CubicO group peptidase (beta-lactamase class C family)